MTYPKPIDTPRLSPIRGFTLMELVAAIAVLAILVTIGIPSFQNLIRNNQVSAQHNELIAMLNFARSEAVRRNRNMVVELNQDGNNWSAFVIDSAGVESEHCPPGSLRCNENSGVLLIGNPPFIEFDNRGYVTPFAVVPVFAIQHSECRTPRHRRDITVLGTGHVSSVEAPCGS